MRLSKASYYADFVVYPPLVLVLVGVASLTSTSLSWLGWISECSIGIVAWTFVEYVMHRFVFHRVPLLTRMHDMHHANPSAFLGTPLWLSLTVGVLCVFLPMWWAAGLEVASGITAGMMLGYLWYIGVHHAIHHWRLDHASFLYRAKRRHVLHHCHRQDGNFGVTSAFWDRVFGTAVDHGISGQRRLRLS